MLTQFNKLCVILLFIPSLSLGENKGIDFNQSTSKSPNFSHLFFGLVATIGLILVLTFVLKKVRGLSFNGQKLINIKSATSISVKEKLVLVESGGQWLLLGVTPNQITTLHRFEELPEEFINTQHASFKDIKNHFSKKQAKE